MQSSHRCYTRKIKGLRNQMSQVMPNLLIQIVEFLKESPIALSRQSQDGRINSAFNEDEIFKCLESNFAINRPNIRDWYDFSFEENNIFYPVNIKVSTTKTTDNLNCKLGIYYALTGDCPPFNNGINWEEYSKKLAQNLKSNEKDYYFLIINKDNPNDVFATSLKRLKHIVPNGNNLPFQVRWNDNRETEQQNDFDETPENRILKNMAESLRQRASIYDKFLRYFPINKQKHLKNQAIAQSRYYFCMECDKCGYRNRCHIDINTMNGNIVTHYRCNKQ